jgi:carbohydrate kinase (thermoresistant glucokinase family)
MSNYSPKAVILMGVAGSGKTAVGKGVATRLNCLFLDADAFHPSANIEKMKQGIPLNDEDRTPWLLALRDELKRLLAAGRSAILACSALKESYRQLMSDYASAMRFVLLDVDQGRSANGCRTARPIFFRKNSSRVSSRVLRSPKKATIIDARKPLDEVIDLVVKAI